MDSNGGPKKINVGVLSLSRRSVVASFICEFEKKSHGNATFNVIFIQLSAEDLDKANYEMKNEVQAVVLLHSIVEGRFSVTDVPDARYDNLLPRLKYLFGSEGVGVIAHSMPNFNDVTKSVQMKVFQARQHTTFKSSGCVILCGKLAEMSDEDWNRLTGVLALAPGQRKLQPTDAANEPIYEVKSERQKSVCELPHQIQSPQADTDQPQKQMKADELQLVIITSKRYSISVEVIQDDIRKKASHPITIVTSTTNDWKASFQSAHAFALLLQEEDLFDLCSKIPPEIRRNNISIFRPLGSPVTTEGREHFKEFEYVVTGVSTRNSSIQLSKKTLNEVVCWLDECYENRSESHEKQKCIVT